jgi:hypothetical protein
MQPFAREWGISLIGGSKGQNEKPHRPRLT